MKNLIRTNGTRIRTLVLHQQRDQKCCKIYWQAGSGKVYFITNVIEQVGPPDFSDPIHFLYDIETNYGFDIDPIYTKQLIYYLSSDSIVTRFEVKESTKE